ncbi:SDR family NAD(P)-dependent oxidoreductase [Haloarcula nitratireducens]|uniref:SDR family NAD(P)-dependent oxidoreductase n=1 Tax=Haloarcula nitratireducens TaxID=2487749 RepID=A0AAW4PE08_9EURY|nr:SDR family NAD(P)-dependent oxidoreductase [Halomicroarcula nitratireducens]MBX0296089.1 SDR family NAD(P)-dependent oxidoreductase [Halomicroarcula nitratireducens]
MPTPEAERVVVVTGANEGIGYHLLRALYERGHRVAGLDIEVGNLRPLRESHPDRIRFYECDVTADADVERAIEGVLAEWGQIDILVNDAAIFDFAPFEARTLADTRREFEVNFFGYLRTTHAVLPHMRERGEGIVHNVSSGVGLVGHPGLSGYAATKGAVEAFTRSLRLELRRENVWCTVMHPPLTRTRSALELGYPECLLSDPADVGRKLAAEIESTGPVVTADWTVTLGLALARRFPSIVEKGTERFVTEFETAAERDER